MPDEYRMFNAYRRRPTGHVEEVGSAFTFRGAVALLLDAAADDLRREAVRSGMSGQWLKPPAGYEYRILREPGGQ